LYCALSNVYGYLKDTVIELFLLCGVCFICFYFTDFECFVFLFTCISFSLLATMINKTELRVESESLAASFWQENAHRLLQHAPLVPWVHDSISATKISNSLPPHIPQS